jgi:RimJ/RimL family protein N-acetyltransferase
MACKKYAFEKIKSDKVYSIIRTYNKSSQNVARRLGMKIVEEITKHYYNREIPHYVFEIIKE